MTDATSSPRLASQPATIHGGNRNPVLLNDVSRAFLVRRGKVNIFVIENTHLSSRRRFLFQLAAGDAMCGVEPREGSHMGLLAVGSLDSEIEPMSAFAVIAAVGFEAWMRALAAVGAHGITRALETRVAEPGSIALASGTRLEPDPRRILWLETTQGCAAYEKSGSAEPGDRATKMILVAGKPVRAIDGLEGVITARDRLCAAELAGFNGICIEDLARAGRPAAAKSETDTSPSTDLASALGRLAGLNGRSPKTDRVGSSTYSDPLRNSLIHLFAALNVTPASAVFDLAAPDMSSESERLALILGGHQLTTREILLRNGWNKAEATPLLAYLSELGEPVALIPAGRKWTMVSRSGNRPVSDDLIHRLGEKALQIYPSLPLRPLNFTDLFSFGFVGARSDLMRLAAGMIAAGALAAIVPFGSGLLVDTAIPHGDVGQIGVIITALLVAAFAGTACDFMRSMALVRAEARFETRLQPALLARLIKLPMSFFRGGSVGDIADRVLAIQRARAILSASAMGAIAGSLVSVLSLVPIVLIDWRLAIVVALMALGLAGLTAAMTYARLRHERRLIADKGKLDGLVLQILMGISKLRASAAEARAFTRWAMRVQTNTSHFIASEGWANAQKSVNAVLPQLAIIALYAVIVTIMKSDALAPPKPGEPPPAPFSAGDFVAVSASFAQVVGAIGGMADAMAQSLGAIPLIERARPIMDCMPDVPTSIRKSHKLAGTIDVRNVSFRYLPTGPLALSDVDIRIGKGEFVAVVGASGSGKSTLLRLLLGFECPERGDVFFDGTSIRRMDLADLRRQVGVVLQNGKLTAGSIQSNIVGQSGLGMAEAIAAARLVGLEADIEAMPMGMHTVLLDGGGTLSGGQRQRILIARALVQAPSILLFDEATSALDNRTQAIVTGTLARLSVTRVVIAHRLSTIESVDRIIVMDRGRVVEVGTHAELMASNGHFAAHARRQMI